MSFISSHFLQITPQTDFGLCIASVSCRHVPSFTIMTSLYLIRTLLALLFLSLIIWNRTPHAPPGTAHTSWISHLPSQHTSRTRRTSLGFLFSLAFSSFLSLPVCSDNLLANSLCVIYPSFCVYIDRFLFYFASFGRSSSTYITSMKQQ